MTAALEGGEWSAARPGRVLPPGKDQVPIVQKAGWASGPVWTGGKSRPPPGFDPGPSSPKSVAIPTELPGPHTREIFVNIKGIKHLQFAVSVFMSFVF